MKEDTVDRQSVLTAMARGDFTRVAERFSCTGYGVELPERGILRITAPQGAPPRMHLLLSVGIHGDETAPIEMLAQILHELAAEPHTLAVDLMLVVGNLAAVEQGKRFVDADMNRLFRRERGELQSAAEAQRADVIMRATAEFLGGSDVKRWHLDLHTAIRPSFYPAFAVMPANIAGERRDRLLDLLGQAGIGAAILSPPSGGTFSAYTATTLDAISATVELGKIGALGCNDLSRFAAARQTIRQLLRSADVVPSKDRPQVFRVTQELIKRSDAFRMMLDRDVKNFTPIAPGSIVAEDSDIVYRTGSSTEYVVFPNPDVRIGLRAGLMVVPI